MKNKYNIIKGLLKTEYFKEYYKENKAHIKDIFKKYSLKNKVKIKKYHKKYNQEHKETLKYNRTLRKNLKQEYDKNYKKQRRATDINFKILTNLRSRINKALQRNSKSKSTQKLLGCSIVHLKQHLKNQFTEGMSFDNYGKWHVDHIKPCASFDLSKSSEQRKCFNYTNLQPLWAEDNLRKSNR